MIPVTTFAGRRVAVFGLGGSLNAGLLDAMNLGWKLAAEARGVAPDGLLDSYHTERHAAGRRTLMQSRAQHALLADDEYARAARELVGELLHGMDDGELFLEYSQSESVALDDGRIRSAAFDTTQGFGLRAIADDAAGYAHSSEISEAAIKRAGATVRAVASGHRGTMSDAPQGTNRALYTDLNPLHEVALSAKTKLLTDIDAYARDLDPRVRQVMASISAPLADNL